MLLVINALGGGHTYTDTQTQTHRHTHIPMHKPKQFQETKRAWALAAHAWFKNIYSFKLLLTSASKLAPMYTMQVPINKQE